MSFIHFCMVLLYVSVPVHCATLLEGDSTDPEQTFSFLMNKHIQDSQGMASGAQALPIGNLSFFASDVSAAGNSKEFAVSVIARDQTKFTGIARKKALIKGKEEDNPLYNKGITHLSLLEASQVTGDPIKPLVVTADSPSTLYLINRFIGLSSELYIALNTPDAQGAATSGIVQTVGAHTYVFSAVKPALAGSAFGDNGSGIAVSCLSINQETPFGHLDAPTGTVIPTATPTALPFDKSSSFLAIANPLSAMGQVVDMHWDYNTKRVYIAVDATAGGAPTDGARSLVVGEMEVIKGIVDGKEHIVASKLHLNPIAPDSAFDGTNSLVGAIGSNAHVVTHRVKTMQTSTKLDYLIIQATVGSTATPLQEVYALPLVTGNSNPALNGTIAKKNDTVVPFYDAHNLFFQNSLQNPAILPADMPQKTDAAAVVGQGPLVAGPITDMLVVNDTVFVTVQNPLATYTGGVFSSTALFDGFGLVKGWTPWQRAIATIDNGVNQQPDGAVGVCFDATRGDFLLQTIKNPHNVTVIKRTTWGQGDPLISQPLIQTVAQEFPLSIESFSDFSDSTPGLLDSTMQIIGGNKKVAFIQSGSKAAGMSDILFSKADDYAHTMAYPNGIITDDFPLAPLTKFITIEGGILTDIGTILTAEIVKTASQGYVVVGGIGGVAILSAPDGSGWDSSIGLTEGFEGLHAGMSFKKLGEYTRVKKLVSDGDFLYVVTDTYIDRIDTTSSTFGTGLVTPVRIADAQTMNAGLFFDALFTQKLALLGTARGLFQNGIGTHIQTITTPLEAEWSFIPLSDSAGPVKRLYAQTPGSRDQALATGVSGGNVYVLSSYEGTNSARLHRLAINSVESNPIDRSTVQLFNELFVKNQRNSYFVDFSQAIKTFATNGAFFVWTKDGIRDRVAEIKALPAYIYSLPRTGNRFLGVRSQAVPVELNGAKVSSAVVRTSASGAFVATGDFGLRIQE